MFFDCASRFRFRFMYLSNPQKNESLLFSGRGGDGLLQEGAGMNDYRNYSYFLYLLISGWNRLSVGVAT